MRIYFEIGISMLWEVSSTTNFVNILLSYSASLGSYPAYNNTI